jgi:hypothetical protein
MAIWFDITGTVYDEDGSTPLEGVQIVAFEQRNIIDGFYPLDPISTDINGQFLISTGSMTGDGTIISEWQWRIIPSYYGELQFPSSPSFRNPTFENDYITDIGVINQDFSKERVKGECVTLPHKNLKGIYGKYNSSTNTPINICYNVIYNKKRFYSY